MKQKKFLILILLFTSCFGEEDSQLKTENNKHQVYCDEHDVRFSLFETYSGIRESPAIAYAYLRTCSALCLNKNSKLKINDTLMKGGVYSCNYLKNNKMLTGFQCDSIYVYKFYLDQISLLDYELLDYLERYSDSIISLSLDGKIIYQDTLNKTSIIRDAPILSPMLEGCF